MELNDPMGELLSSLEHIVLTREVIQAAPALKGEVSIPEPKRIREITGMEIDEFALALGVSVSSVKSWEAKRTKPSRSAQKLMQLIQFNPCLSRELLG
jgi:putative transcriptional regulator